MTRGGRRDGAGRPKGAGKFGEATKPIRIPESMIDSVMTFIDNKGYQLPLYTSAVSAGFPSPADDHTEEALDLNQHLVKHPTATFFVRVSGESMIEAGIHPHDILIVDRSLEVISGKIVIAVLNGELTVKRYIKQGSKIILMPENKAFSPINIEESDELSIWGTVTSVIHHV